MRLLLIICLTSLMISCSTTPQQSNPRIVSGFVQADGTSLCVVAPLYGADQIDCSVEYSSDKRVFYVQLITKGVFRRTQPVCITDGFTHLDKATTPGKKIKTRLSLVGTSQVWVELASFRVKPEGALFSFICTN